MTASEIDRLLYYLRRAENFINNADTDPKFTKRLEAFAAVKSARLIVEKYLT